MSEDHYLSIDDSEVGASLDADLRQLLFECFPHEPVLKYRRYVHESPTRRFLFLGDDNSIRAHAAVHLKQLRVEDKELNVGGVAEVAVAPEFRGRGYVAKLMNEVHQYLLDAGIIYSFLFGGLEIYQSSGYRAVTSPIRFVEYSTGIVKEEMNPLASVAELGNKPWPDGVVDLRGYLF